MIDCFSSEHCLVIALLDINYFSCDFSEQLTFFRYTITQELCAQCSRQNRECIMLSEMDFTSQRSLSLTGE